jgi:endonuclease/exonuclease/phosphatase family metal-dependent hydrolase
MQIRRSVSLSVALALSFSAFAGEFVPLRVVTYNVLEGIGAPADFTAQQTGLFLTTNDLDGAGPNRGLNPDIVALQECRSTTNLNAFRDAYLPGYQMVRVGFGDAGGNFQAYFVRPDIVILDTDEYAIGGPRPMFRMTVEVPGAAKTVTLYNAHFKAFGDSSSQAQRRTNAQESGIEVWRDRTLGLDLDDNFTRETPVGNQIYLGDLNSNNNFDGTLNGLFTNVINSQPTGVLNLPVETLAGRLVGGSPRINTFPGSNSRLDYICLDEELASRFDSNDDGSLSQDEINAMGFVFYSQEDPSLANGSSSATSFASDHRPVVFDVLLEAEPVVAECPGDTNGDNVVNFTDLNAVLADFGLSGESLTGDVNGDGVVNFTDLNEVLANFGTEC